LHGLFGAQGPASASRFFGATVVSVRRRSMDSSKRKDDASTAFDGLARDAHGVVPVDMHQFVCSRLSETEARQIFLDIVGGSIDRDQLSERLGLPSDSITQSEFRRLSGMYSLWFRWESDDR
jgi:hypothetical protein